MLESKLSATSRRDFLSQLAAATSAIAAPSFVTIANTGLLAPVHAHGASAESNGPAKPKVGVIFTELRFRSHAFNILENFLGPYLFRGKMIEPPVEVVSLFADQFPSNDMARDVARRYRIPLFPSIDATPFLEFAYEPRDFTAFRENGESWRVLPPGSPEPKDMRAANKE